MNTEILTLVVATGTENLTEIFVDAVRKKVKIKKNDRYRPLCTKVKKEKEKIIT